MTTPYFGEIIALIVAISFWIFFPKTPVNKNIEVKH